MKAKHSLEWKEGALKSPHHHRHHVGLIILTVCKEWPENYPIIITRGYEDCIGGSKTSRHLPPFFAAFDFRTRHLPRAINREELKNRIMQRLGSDYYGYYKYYEQNGKPVEWVHIQWNRALPCF